MSFAILKRKRLWIGVAFILAVPVLLFLLDVFVWYPNSPRGVFDRIEVGMTKSEVEAHLATLEEGKKRSAVSAVIWTVKDGQWHSIQFRHELLIRLYSGTAMERRVTHNGIIFVRFDDEARVDGKTWFEFEGRPGLLQRIRSWFGL
ncbi:MAG: hypothetical protein L0Y72_08990 [Gemmataceae bacterium]|nr:hypothetical protein [Gemmataceae bacterium]MCI0739166.1 hypothetical protein [Gemmataceae bacterium]